MYQSVRFYSEITWQFRPGPLGDDLVILLNDKVRCVGLNTYIRMIMCTAEDFRWYVQDFPDAVHVNLKTELCNTYRLKNMLVDCIMLFNNYNDLKMPITE